jgi:hypothetical protein
VPPGDRGEVPQEQWTDLNLIETREPGLLRSAYPRHGKLPLLRNVNAPAGIEHVVRIHDRKLRSGIDQHANRLPSI